MEADVDGNDAHDEEEPKKTEEHKTKRKGKPTKDSFKVCLLAALVLVRSCGGGILCFSVSLTCDTCLLIRMSIAIPI